MGVVENTRGGQEIKCGSECILTYGIAVKGAETAEAAKKLLETAIRKAIKKAKIITWHKEYGFEGDFLTVAQNALLRIRRGLSGEWTVSWVERHRRLSEVAHAQRELSQLITFYRQHGWLNTKTRWESWLRVARCAVNGDNSAADNLPAFKAWVQPVKRVRVAKAQKSVQLALGGI